MFTRIRWFAYGALLTVVAGVFVVSRARRLRARLNAEGVGRVAASYAADLIEAGGRFVQRSVPLDGTGSS